MRPRIQTTEEWKSYRKWIWFFLAFILCYVVVEFVFNAMLLNVSSGFGVDEEEFRRLELFGRILASVGCTISLFGFFSAKIRGSGAFTFTGAFFTFALALGTIGPLFYYVSDRAIEEGIVQRSSAEDRYTAVSMDFKKRLQAAGFNESFAYRDEMMADPHNPEAMTYLASYPLVGTMNDEVRSRIKHVAPLTTMEDQQNLVYYTSIHAMSSAKEAYTSYQKYEPDMNKAYQEYMKASREATSKIRGLSDAEFNKIWIPVRDELRRSWAKLEPYLTRERQFIRRYMRNDNAGYLYNSYVSALQRKHGMTLEKLESRDFLKKLQRRGVFGYKIVERANGNAERIKVSGVPNPYALYCGGEGRIGRSCRPTQDQLYRFMWDWANYDLYQTKKTAGYPVSVKTYQDFLSHEKTGQAVREKIASKAGIYLDPSFDTAFRGGASTTRRYIDQAVHKDGMRTWRRAFSRSSGIPVRKLDGLEPNMSFHEFIQVEGVADKVRDITGGFYSSKLALNMEMSTFYSQVMADVARSQYNTLYSRYTRKPNDYVKTRHGIEDGLSAYRMAIIPPIALMMSMFFSLIALFKLPLLINELICAYSEGKYDYRTAAKWILIGGIATVIMTPFLLSPMSELSSSMRHDIESLTETSSALALIQHWLYVVEPHLYGFGQGVLEVMDLNNLEIVHHSMYPNLTK